MDLNRGPSPHARGAPIHVPLGRRMLGTIPAGAGSALRELVGGHQLRLPPDIGLRALPTFDEGRLTVTSCAYCVGEYGQQGEVALSQYYDMGDQTLWNPSNGASRLFMSQVSVYQAELGLPSGIGPMHADECQIDPVAFKAFVDALLAWHRRTSHAVMAALSDGLVATVLVLAERAGIEVNWPPAGFAEGDGLKEVQVPTAPDSSECAWVATLQQKSRELGRFMAA